MRAVQAVAPVVPGEAAALRVERVERAAAEVQPEAQEEAVGRHLQQEEQGEAEVLLPLAALAALAAGAVQPAGQGAPEARAGSEARAARAEFRRLRQRVRHPSGH